MSWPADETDIAAIPNPSAGADGTGERTAPMDEAASRPAASAARRHGCPMPPLWEIRRIWTGHQRPRDALLA